MNRAIVVLLVIWLLSGCRMGETIEPDFYSCLPYVMDSSLTNPNQQKYQQLLNDITAEGVVGLLMSVYQPSSGMWVGASGQADLHNAVDMSSCNITRVGSTVKMFTALTVLILQEEGKLDLDDHISDYLEGDVIDKIENADQATIRQLLQ